MIFKKPTKKALSLVLSLCMVSSLGVTAGASVNAVTTTAETVQATDTTAVSSQALATDVQTGQILQIWNWSYNNTKSNMAKIAEQGFSAIQTSPIQQSKEGTNGCSMTKWWLYYQPAYMQIDNTGNSALGNKAEFTAMCEEAHKYGIKVIVDAVLNHTGDNGGNNISPAVDPDLKNDSSCWHDISISTTNWNDRYDITQHNMGGLPDLNTGSSKVQNKAIAFLKECVDCGADGFRFDGAKHIETPSDSGCASQFWPNVLNATTSYAQSKRSITPYYYGEILDSTGGVAITAYTQYMSITDNGTANGIRGSVNSSNASGAATSYLSKGAAANKTVLWNESHDTYANEGSGSVSTSKINQTWAMVGTRSTVCGMYFARPNSLNDSMGGAAQTGWTNPEVKGVNDFDNYFGSQSEYLSSENGCAYNERGTTGVVITTMGGSQSVSLTAHKMVAGTYKDTISGNTFTVANGKISGQVGSTGIATVYNAVIEPTASITPASSSYKTDTTSLTLNYENATSGQYKIDNGSWQDYKNGDKITIGSGLAYGTTTTVTVKATDGTTTSKEAEYTYKKTDPAAGVKIYFDNTSYNWSKVYAYVYTGTGTTAVSMAAWPGTAMTLDSTSGYYVLDIPEAYENGTVMFTESSTATTNRYPADMQPGLSIGGSSKVLKASYAWTDYDGPTPTSPTVPPTTPTSPTTPPTPTQPVTSTEGYYRGDVNSDTKVTIKDAALIQKHVAKVSTLTGTKLAAADVTGDGSVTTADIVAVLRYMSQFTNTYNIGAYVQGSVTPTQAPTSAPTQKPTSAP